MNLHSLVAETAAAHPDRLAVACGEHNLTYRELDRRANGFARRLARLGVRRGDRVLLWSDKSVDVVVAMQAVLRLGAAYVPMDGTAPVRRVLSLAEACGAAVLCADTARLDALGSAPAVPVVDLRETVTTVDSLVPVAEAVGPDELAYILYTSGSTGTPKGVCISHRNALAFVHWAAAELEIGPADRLANHAPLVFDLSVMDLYAAFATGASVHLLPAELAYSPAELVRFLRDARITVWYSVPSALVLMMRHGGLLDAPPPPGLRVVSFAGEPFPIAGVRSLAAWTPARLLNLYGPTETNVCTFHEVTPGDLARDQPVPIGRACSGDKVWAERADGGVAGPGEEGELLVDGPTVLMGYWGAPPQAGPYRTGDIVRVLDDGAFDYVGRADHTVKVRGHRIGLAEVEVAITTHPAVDDAAVIVTGAGIEARLVAFVVPAPGQSPGRLAIKAHCATTLPSYAVVDQVHLTEDLPRTANGKVDRRALAGRPALAQERRPG
ncbi:amino acid adenylation domain-containing protein [Amycolatopsis sp. 195334CR]|uniref:amino acid adenylation domain-containing protein n=1 Tax=Amycolatopsis sp. 195334CR TaxID=2814588 RepID=UPI001A8E39AF|nr:amino acid adenylation domain-containing protein [Amycolatopsis sp. 195334CR]MBN6039757.1 amino acid adenylation domain-containing protein [Amycolatopsis sp. 195334CR]